MTTDSVIGVAACGCPIPESADENHIGWHLTSNHPESVSEWGEVSSDTLSLIYHSVELFMFNFPTAARWHEILREIGNELDRRWPLDDPDVPDWLAGSSQPKPA
jgi:hypothetical protein